VTAAMMPGRSSPRTEIIIFFIKDAPGVLRVIVSLFMEQKSGGCQFGFYKNSGMAIEIRMTGSWCERLRICDDRLAAWQSKRSCKADDWQNAYQGSGKESRVEKV
jgi:hypothetical protein